ncbi:hypothetical protein ACOMHN_027966 [Nucella lapillus]
MSVINRCQEGESGPEVWYIVVTILATIVVILLATLAVFVCRKRIARTREMTRREIQNETEVQELSDLEGGGPGRNLLVQPAEEVEGLYSEINDLPSFPCEDAASAMPSSSTGADGSGRQIPGSNRQWENKKVPERTTLKKTPEATALVLDKAQGTQQAEGTQMASIPPTKPTARHDPEADSSSVFPSFDLASIFSSNPSEQLAADKPEELGAQSPDTYDRPGVYMNATEDRQLYEKVQTGSNVLYQNCTKEKL